MNDRNPANHSQIARIARDVAFSSDLLALQSAVETAGPGAPATEFAAAAEEVRELARRGEQAFQEARPRKQEKTF